MHTVKSRYYASPFLCHSRYYAAFDHPQRNSIENKVTMPPLNLDTMPREIYECSRGTCPPPIHPGQKQGSW